MDNKVIQGDCLEVLKTLPENSVDAIITDPPYELGFMGKQWDNTGIANNKDMWAECLRVLKPGGHLLSFGGTRTYHRMASAIEDAGFEVRDMIEWVYGSGFPKSLNIGKQDGCNEWEGWGTALKPAHEPICMARKPLSEKTVAENCLKWGVGGINIDDSRVETSKEDAEKSSRPNCIGKEYKTNTYGNGRCNMKGIENGRFPANLIHDNSEEVRECFPESSKGWGKATNSEMPGKKSMFGIGGVNNHRYDMGGEISARFFKSIIYQTKASKKDRGEGNNHATVKPTKLMEYLINMVSREGGVILDPFAGSGTTLLACKNINRVFIGIEKEQEYIDIINKRLNGQS